MVDRMSKPICIRCRDHGYVFHPCAACGAIKLGSGDVAYIVGSVFGDDVPPIIPKDRKRRADR